MLLLLDHNNWVMEWIIRKIVCQCLAMVLAVAFLSYFALCYPLLKNTLCQLIQILHPLHCKIGALTKILKKVFWKILGLVHDPMASD